MKIRPLVLNLVALAASLFSSANTAFAQVDAGKDALYVKSLAAFAPIATAPMARRLRAQPFRSLRGLARLITLSK